MEALSNPFIQLIIYGLLVLSTLVISRLNAATILLYSITILLVWILIAACYGIPSSVDWSYYLKLTISLLFGYGIAWGSLWIAEKQGQSYHSEGSIYMLSPVMLYPLIMVPVSIIKFIVSAVRIPRVVYSFSG